MHRWFFADDDFTKGSRPPSSQTAIATPALTIPARNWIFKVHFDWNLCSNEFLAISGSCRSLGTWDVQFSLPLKRIENSCLWTLMVPLAGKEDIRYRYLVCVSNNEGKKVVRFWETHFGGRLIRRDQLQDIESIDQETFGVWNNNLKIERGWLNSDINVVQFKFYHAPFTFTASTHTKLLKLHIKITPLKIKDPKICENLTNLKVSTETSDEESDLMFAFCEVASLQDKNGEFRKQPKHGTLCGPDNLVMFNLTLNDNDHTGFLIDLYNFSPKSASDIPLNHFGYQYVMPQELRNSEGTLRLPIMCGTKHRAIGWMKCDYLVVKPMPGHNFNLENTFQRHWNSKHEGTYIGHRGCGRSFWFEKNILRENTIRSLNLAIKHNADMVEFDVQLTKDKIPILWHDFQLQVTTRVSNDPQENDLMYLPLTTAEVDALESAGERVGNDVFGFPLSSFTQQQLARVKVYEPADEETCCSDNKNNRPFATLEQVLKQVHCKAGFVIDIKWPQNVISDAGEGNTLPHVDKNEFVDIIVHEVLQNANSRRIVFSSFDADICTMIRLKQNIYPVMFLIQPYSSVRKFIDPRGKFIPTGIYFAYAMELLGVNINCSDILDMPGNVSDLHERDLSVFSWGKETRNEDTRKYLKILGVDGIVCDRINGTLEPIDLKEDFFNIIPFHK